MLFLSKLTQEPSRIKCPQRAYGGFPTAFSTEAL
jgi:hypothetical protein